MSRQDVEERGWGVARSRTGVQGPRGAKGGGEAERGWSASVESLLVKGLSLVVDRATDIRHSSIT